MFKSKSVCVVLFLVLVCSMLPAAESGGGADAAPLLPDNSSLPVFKLDKVTDGVLIGTGIAAAAIGFCVNHFSETDVWDGAAPDRSSVPFFDRWSIHPYSSPLDITGDILQYASILLPAVLLVTPSEEWMTIAVMYAESTLLAWGIKENMKNCISRLRPYMYTGGKNQADLESGDFDRSFPSAHTVAAFNGAAFASTVFSLYFPESKWKVPVIAGSISMATATAFLRVGSANHFLSDVIAGAVIGTVTGILVPMLHYVQKPENSVQIQVGLGEISLTAAY